METANKAAATLLALALAIAAIGSLPRLPQVSITTTNHTETI